MNESKQPQVTEADRTFVTRLKNHNGLDWPRLIAQYRAEAVETETAVLRKNRDECADVFKLDRAHEFQPNLPICQCPSCNLHRRINDLQRQLTSAQEEARRLQEALQDFVDNSDAPSPNCSCHIFAPCGDCSTYGHLREMISNGRTALATPSSVPLHIDTERLDWLDANMGKIVPGGGDARYWILGQKETEPNKATNIRAAIDAARASKTKSP